MKEVIIDPRIVVVSDLHAGSTVGLCPPEFELEDGGIYKANKFQGWLWNNWIDFCAHIPNGAIVVINGDWTQGVNQKDIQIVTASIKDMRRIGVAVVQPLIERASQIYVIRGTEFHGGIGEQDTEAMAEMINAERELSTGQFSRWELWLKHGLLFHFAHHIAVSGSPIALANELRLAKLNSVDHGTPIPDVIVRSHVHAFNKYSDGKRWVYTTPAWQLRTAYIMKKRPLAVACVGGLIFDVNGELGCQELIYPLPQPKIEVTSHSLNSLPNSTKSKTPLDQPHLNWRNLWGTLIGGFSKK